jgi:hypothetical protein
MKLGSLIKSEGKLNSEGSVFNLQTVWSKNSSQEFLGLLPNFFHRSNKKN